VLPTQATEIAVAETCPIETARDIDRRQRRSIGGIGTPLRTTTTPASGAVRSAAAEHAPHLHAAGTAAKG